MKREACIIPDVMIISTVPPFAFLLYFCWWCHKINNLNGSVVTGKSQTSAYCIDLAIAHAVNTARPKARFKRRSIHAPNLTDELSTAEERRLNQIGSAD